MWSGFRTIGLESKGKPQPCCGNNLLNRKEGKPDPAVFESPKDFKKPATLKDVLPSDPFLDDED